MAFLARVLGFEKNDSQKDQREPLMSTSNSLEDKTEQFESLAEKLKKQQRAKATRLTYGHWSEYKRAIERHESTHEAQKIEKPLQLDAMQTNIDQWKKLTDEAQLYINREEKPKKNENRQDFVTAQQTNIATAKDFFARAQKARQLVTTHAATTAILHTAAKRDQQPHAHQQSTPHAPANLTDTSTAVHHQTDQSERVKALSGDLNALKENLQGQIGANAKKDIESQEQLQAEADALERRAQDFTKPKSTPQNSSRLSFLRCCCRSAQQDHDEQSVAQETAGRRMKA